MKYPLIIATLTALFSSVPAFGKTVEGCLKGQVKSKACDTLIINYWRHNAAIERIAREEGIDASLLKALVAYESRYNHKAVSPKNATGLTQVMPATAAGMGVSSRQHLFNADVSLRAGSRYLRSMFSRFGRLDLALAAYNAGPTRVARAKGIPNIKETRHYVRNIMSLYGQFKQHEAAQAGGRHQASGQVNVTGTAPKVTLPARPTGPMKSRPTQGAPSAHKAATGTKEREGRFQTSNAGTSSQRFQAASN